MGYLNFVCTYFSVGPPSLLLELPQPGGPDGAGGRERGGRIQDPHRPQRYGGGGWGPTPLPGTRI